MGRWALPVARVACQRGGVAIHHIIVGVDGSTGAAAARWAGELGRALGAEVIAVHAAGLLAHLGDESIVATASRHDELVGALEGPWCEPLRTCGVRHRSRLEEGPPTMALLRAAEQEDADLVVVGTRGAGGAPGLLLGSTSHQVAQLSPRPVAVVPQGRGRDGPAAAAETSGEPRGALG